LSKKKGGGVENAPKSNWVFHGKQSTFPETEDELCAYVMNLKKSAYKFFTEILKLEASEVA
jgi:hypothetical protein